MDVMKLITDGIIISLVIAILTTRDTILSTQFISI